MNAPSKYELVWAATFALEFKAFRESSVIMSDLQDAQWAVRRADRAVAALIDADKADATGTRAA